MAITKTGSYVTKEAGDIGDYLSAWRRSITDEDGKIRRRAGKVFRAAKATAVGTGKVVAPLARGATNTLGAIGKGVAKHPAVGLPAVGLGLFGMHQLPDRLKKYLMHTDQNTNATMYSPTARLSSGIGYKNRAAENYYNNRNIYF